jgi:hypothetical protein
MRRSTAIRRLQYIKSRQVLRMWPEEGAAGPVEVPRVALLQALASGGEDDSSPATPVRYLLVAAVRTARSSAPQLAAFGSGADARAAFQELRLRTAPPTEWAQLVSLDRNGQLRTLCWFGAPHIEVSPVKPPVRRRRTWPRQRHEPGAAPGSDAA